MSVICPYCRSPFESHHELRTCEACATPHHGDCFAENGGCTVFGCAKAPGDEPMIRVLLEDIENSAALSAPAPQHRLLAPPVLAWEPEAPPAMPMPMPTEELSSPVLRRYGVLLGRPYSAPPGLTWPLVLSLSILSCGLFLLAWEIALAWWVRDVQARSRALYYYGAAVVFVLLGVASAAGGRINAYDAPAVTLLVFVLIGLITAGRFSLKSSLEDYLDQAGLSGLCLSEAMTFFFGSVYFQYYLNHRVDDEQLMPSCNEGLPGVLREM